MKIVFESITLLHFYFALLNIDGLFGERPKIDARFNWSAKGIENGLDSLSWKVFDTRGTTRYIVSLKRSVL